jgi:hypothetical protein
MKDLGRQQGRIIILGDGTEGISGPDVEMLDHDEEEKDLDSQVIKGPANPEPDRSEREGTPGPNATHTEASNGNTFEPAPQNVEVNHRPANSQDNTLGAAAH